MQIGRHLLLAVLAAGALLTGATALRAQPLTLGVQAPHIPNFAGVGVGWYPKYIGSKDLGFGAVPFARVSWGEHYLEIAGTYGALNLLNHPNWRVGPAGVVRLGRNDVGNDAVNDLPDIDPSLNLGAFVGYDLPASADPRDRWWFGGTITQNVTDQQGGYVASASIRRWLPVGRYGVLGLAAGLDYGSADYMDTYFSVSPSGSMKSGLPAYEADQGVRDAQALVIFMQPLSPKWLAGAGVLYTRLLGNAADSPIVSDEGTRDQFVFGVGLARMF